MPASDPNDYQLNCATKWVGSQIFAHHNVVAMENICPMTAN